MTKREALRSLLDEIECYIEEWDKFPDGTDQVTTNEIVEFGIGDGINAYAELHISAKMWVYKGDCYHPTEWEKEIYWGASEIEFFDEDGESLFGEIKDTFEGYYKD